jgi:hypothetical protein
MTNVIKGIRGFVSIDAEKRFFSKVNKMPSGCWEWTGCRAPYGYGDFYVNGKTIRAHRYSYQVFVGPLKKGMFICHKCDNPPCVNPDHLFQGTHTENVRDSLKKGRHRSGKHYPQEMKKVCKNGHKLEGDNIIFKKDGRQCKTCKQETNAAFKRNNPDYFKKRRKKLATLEGTATGGENG